jgi:hypothetical protein
MGLRACYVDSLIFLNVDVRTSQETHLWASQHVKERALLIHVYILCMLTFE